jgi:hypothetical protein
MVVAGWENQSPHALRIPSHRVTTHLHKLRNQFSLYFFFCCCNKSHKRSGLKQPKFIIFHLCRSWVQRRVFLG